ncbi:MAG: nitrogenase iron-molybdenum cofactor biosynthesis protein NifN, partial [Chloroflexaceae bacterium]|nr:nitrogenase iron-molybdenum cofactor biosynthesis protein NifN [Chloroflexaceae bacterium]
ARAAHLADLPVAEVVIGDLEDLEQAARDRQAELIVTNSHGAEIAKRLGCALLRAGYPIYDQYGAPSRVWTGYAGTRQTVFDLANLLAAQYREIPPYRSVFWRGTHRDAERPKETPC